MRFRHLQTRFVLAGFLVVAVAVAGGLWSALTFAHLSAAADRALAEAREKIDLTAALAGSLEREDDALLLALSGDTAGARRALAAARRRGDECYRRLREVLAGDPSGPQAGDLGQALDRYRQAGDRLVAQAGRPDALERYHRHVNPLLRQAVADCGQIREGTFESLRLAGVRARDEAAHATRVVAAMSVVALVVVTAVSVWLARGVLRPVRALTESVEAVRQGDFERRVPAGTDDELGQLAAGFNRMAETLAEYRASSLGELLAAKSTLEATLNALPDAVLVVSPDGTLAALNPRARALLKAQGAGSAGHLRELPLRPAHRQAVEAALAGRLGQLSRADFGLALRAVLDGGPRRFMLVAAPIPEFAPRRCGAVLVLDDVTEFARLDELRGELIGVASHELKTPLTTVRVHLRLLAEEAEPLTPRQRDMLEAALAGCDELGDTIDELLDVTRIEAGRLRLEQAPVDLAAILERVLRGLRPRFDDASVHLQVVRDAESAVAQGDAARLRTVLTNLLTNALKYSPSGTTVKVQIGSRAEAGQPVLEVAVIDQGPGIPAEFRQRVFEKFFRVEHHLGGDADGVRGTGIGLYLCREIIKAHGGSIHCEPGEGGVGTRVAFTVPAFSPAP
jgi:NtrC-family two-component system sensor histidine kinase KinB